MNIRKVDSQPVVPAAPQTTTAKAEQANRVALPVDTVSKPADTAAAKALGTAAGAHVPVPSMGDAAIGAPRLNGPVSLTSRTAQDAIAKSYEALNTAGRSVDASQRFTPRSVEVDSLGMTHVRMDRTHEGVKVFGEQVISHLGRDGKVSSITGEESAIPAGLGKEATKLSAKDAEAVALKAFGRTPDRQPAVEKVIVQGADGQYHTAYHVVASDLSAKSDPAKMNYLIDANTGENLQPAWNQIDAFIKKEDISKAKKSEGLTVTGSATPKTKISDKSTVTSTIKMDADFDLTNVKLNVDIKHSQRGDLKVSITSPSGKTVVVSDRVGGSADDLKRGYDLSQQFKGENGKGEWKLTVQDLAKKHVGTLNGWSLELTGAGGPPPPPPPPTGGKDDTTMYSGKVEIGATKNADGTYQLLDKTRGQGVETRDAMNGSDGSAAKQINDNNNVWGEASDPARSKAAVDAQYGGQMTYDFYKDILGRDSIDGKGEKLVSNVHIEKDYVNAYWDGTQMNYGDGDGSTATALTALDIAGHEITHGLTERTAGLNYSGESGGINESMSDIMGKGVEWYAAQKNPDVKFSWGVGERVWTPGTPGDALRYMNDPTKDDYSVDNYKNYPKQTEVHGSSGIMNNAFTLLVEGGKNRTSGITVDSQVGMKDALQIYGRALTTYMTPNTNFAQARDATIKAATDLFGANSTQVAKVKESWHAVGVG